MARSSRHKSSKHGSREAKDYSDSEKDLLLKGSSSSRAVKESASSEKRKLDLKLVDDKELVGYGGVELGGEYGGSSSKRRKEKVNHDRWISGDSSEHAVLKSEASMKEYKSRSSRRDDDLEVGIDGDEGRKNGRKADSKHHRSDRKERGEKEGGSKHERKGKEVSKSEKLFDGDRKQGVVGDERGGKHASITDINVSDEYRSTEPEKDPERHALRKRDGSGDGDKRQKSIEERNDKHLPSRDDTSKSKKHRDDSHRDKRAKDGYRDEVDKENRHLDAHDRDGHGTRDHTRDRSDDKHLRNEKNDLETQGKKSKPHNYDYDRDHDHGRHDHDHDHHRDRERDDRDHGTDRDRERERGREREREHDRYRRERDRERGHIHDRDYCYDRRRDRDHDHDRRYSSHADERNSRHKDERGRRRSPDDYDNYYDEKSRSVRGESVARKERTLSHKARVDNISSGNQREPSPSSRRYDVDKFRDASRDSTKLGDSSRDRTGASNTFDGVSKKRLMEKSTKSDDNKFGNFPEKSPSTKTYPVGFRERSPSTTSLDRRFSNRTGQRRSLDVDEADWRSSGSNDVREGSINDDRQSKELSVKKSKGDENSQVESPFYQRSSQARVPGPSSFKAGADSPLVMGTQGENSGFHPGSSYRRSSDPNVGRGHGNAWNSAPNWAAPLPNGFMPIPHGPTGPHHGGFPTMIPQFPPPLFGVRPSMEMNHPGLPYHIAEADRFSSHLRPPEWQMGGSRYPSFHGWDANNGIINNEPSMYGPPQMLNGQGRDTNVNSDVALGSQREGQVMKASADETSVVMDAQGSHNENSYHDDQGKSVKTRTSSASSPMKETPLFPSNVPAEKTPESFNDDDNVQSLRAYLSKLDISIKLSDPEVYNQCVNVAVEENNGYLDEDLDGCEFSEEVASLGSEASKFSMDTTLFPVVEDSIFKRAMDMYNALRKPLKTPNGENLDNFPSPSTEDPIQTPMLIEKGNNPVQPDEPKSQDELLLALPREVLPPSANEETNMDKPEAAWCHENEGEIPNPDVNGEHSEEMGSDHAVDDGHDCAVEVVLNNTVPSTPEPNIASHVVKTDAVDDSHDCAVEVTLNSTVPSAPDLNTASHVVKTDALDSASCAADEVAFNGTIPSSPDPNTASGVKTGTMDSACCAAVEEVPFNSTVTSGPDLNTASHGVKTDVVDSASCAVSSPSILSHGPVNVCEALMSVSNVSESLVISRIHHAPESTR